MRTNRAQKKYLFTDEESALICNALRYRRDKLLDIHKDLNSIEKNNSVFKLYCKYDDILNAIESNIK